MNSKTREAVLLMFLAYKK